MAVVPLSRERGYVLASLGNRAVARAASSLDWPDGTLTRPKAVNTWIPHSGSRYIRRLSQNPKCHLPTSKVAAANGHIKLITYNILRIYHITRIYLGK